MNVGLLWYDNDAKRTLEDKIGQAAKRYREKYGRWPNTCYVHLDQRELADYRLENGRDPIQVLSAPNILLHHLWLGESAGDSPQKHRRIAS